MSALEQTPFTPTDRRTMPRVRVKEAIPILIGRGEGVLVDLSERGARVRHSVTAHRGSMVRLSFEWQGERFAANAEVLASRVIALGSGPQYESRLRFLLVTEANARILTRVLASIESRAVREWVANLRGWSDESHELGDPQFDGSYLRCRLVGRKWEIKRTRERKQPDDGFLVPENVALHEIDHLCEAYVHLDADGRHLIRLIASAVVGFPSS